MAQEFATPINMGGNSITNIAIPSSITNGSWQGLTARLQAAESLVRGDICYINSASKLAKTDADALATSYAQFIALGTISLDATGQFGLPGGFLRDDALYAFTVGGPVYLSTTAGGVTQTAPSGVDDVITYVGVAYNADVLWFNPAMAYVEHI